MNKDLCPCHSGKLASQCCLPIIRGEIKAATALELMRSRYTAFAIEDASYLLNTWMPTNRPDRINFDPRIQWIGLKIIQTRDGRTQDNQGWVKFVAKYKLNGKGHRMEENSFFQKIDDQWYYVEGINE